MTGGRRSRRFSGSRLAEKLIPVVLVMLLLGLLAVLILTGLSLFGWMPGG
jgi:uncharacterized membrane protein YesL